MHRSLYEKVRKKVMNEQRKTQMNTCRALYNKLICVFICAESTVGCCHTFCMAEFPETSTHMDLCTIIIQHQQL